MAMRRQIPRFLLIGGTTVLLDLIVYLFLLELAVPPSPAKATSFAAGALFAYAANRVYTFEAKHDWPTFLRFWAVYLVNLVLNTAVNASAVAALTGMPGSIMAAFLLATAVSATANFLGMKHYVFSNDEKSI